MQRDIRQPLQAGVNSPLAWLVAKRCSYFPSLENFLYELKRLVQGSAAEGARATIQPVFKYIRKMWSVYPCNFSRVRTDPKSLCIEGNVMRIAIKLADFARPHVT